MTEYVLTRSSVGIVEVGVWEELHSGSYCSEGTIECKRTVARSPRSSFSVQD
jgi:hypothetical protein